MKLDTNESSYQDRQGNINKGEELFEKWMTDHSYNFKKLGFDEKTNNIDGFWLMHPLLRNLPDYITYSKEKDILTFIQVKGTCNIKIDDINNWNLFESLFCNDKAKLIIALCFYDDIKFYTLKKLNKLLTNTTIKEFHDGKQYVTIKT